MLVCGAVWLACIHISSLTLQDTLFVHINMSFQHTSLPDSLECQGRGHSKCVLQLGTLATISSPSGDFLFAGFRSSRAEKDNFTVIGGLFGWFA